MRSMIAGPRDLSVCWWLRSPQTGRDAVSGVVGSPRLCWGVVRGTPVSFFGHKFGTFGGSELSGGWWQLHRPSLPISTAPPGHAPRHQQPQEGGNGAPPHQAGTRGRGRGGAAHDGAETATQEPRRHAAPRERAAGTPTHQGPH